MRELIFALPLNTDSKMSRLAAPLVFAISFTLYLITLAPGVTFTDSGELAGACSTLGVAHPTGYPMFVMLGHLWSLLPISVTTIYKLNLFAAFCTALSSMVFYWLCSLMLEYALPILHQKKKSLFAAKTRKAEKKESDSSTAMLPTNLVTIISLCSALCYAFARTVWSQATSIEVYSLHLLMMNAAMYLSLRASIIKTKKAFLIASLAIGLSFTNHLTTILIVVPVSLLFYYQPGENRFGFSPSRLRLYALMLACVMACSAVYLYLPLRGAAEPWFNWGAVHRGWEQFSYHAFGKQYSVWLFGDEAGVAAKQFKVFLGLVPFNLAFIGIAAAVWGFVALWRKRELRAIALFLTTLVLVGVIYSINYSIHDIHSYFLSAFVSLLLAMAVGLTDIMRRFQRYSVACFLLPCLALVINYPVCNERNNELVREYVKLIVDPLPKNAVIFSQQWDYFCSAFWYLQQVEGYRPDVVMIEKELLRRTWYPYQLRRWYPDAISSCTPEVEAYMQDLIVFERDAETFKLDPSKTKAIQRKFITLLNAIVDKNISSRAVFLTQEVLDGEQGFADNFSKVPYGLVIQLCGPNQALQLDYSMLHPEKFIQCTRLYNDDHLEKDIARITAQELLNSASKEIQFNRIIEARKALEWAVQLDKKNYQASQQLQRLKEAEANK